MQRLLQLRPWLRKPTLPEPAVKAATWPRSLARVARDAVVSLGAGVVIGAIGWELLEQKTRSYWT
jgi:hypothetical protein